MTPPPTRIGIDTGGTFTDFVLLDEHGIHVHKLRSTPADPSQAILEGIRHLTSDPTLEITHGSTVATNALLERKGARVALLATVGFEDILRIGRQTRARLYDFLVEAPRPLIDPALTFGVHERLAYDGSILEPLNPDEPARLIAALRAASVESVALCLLHSYANPIHERTLAEALRAAGFLVSASHEILPEYREFERWSTTAVNAYVTPLMSSYLTRLEQGLAESTEQVVCPTLTTASSSLGWASAAGRPSQNADTQQTLQAAHPTLRIMQSNGGSLSAAQASRAAVQTILSGPAAGVVGAQALAAASGQTRIITFDMGGTSTDVALIDGHIAITNDSVVGDFPVRLPVLDIHTVGAGGGSVAWIDTGGSLRVGPRSAGADPGPACYGTGDHLTVTDANLLLGRLDPAFFLGGRMALDVDRPAALARALAKQLSLTPRRLAEGILRIANANMEQAIRVVSVQRGHDPRDFALLAFGGAGGLHACDLAAALDIPTVLIPQHSGVLSALGMLLADVTHDYSASVLKPLPPTQHLGAPSIEASSRWVGSPDSHLTESYLHQALAPLLARAQHDLASEGFPGPDILLQPSLDMRYRGQAYEIPIPFSPETLSLSNLEAAFHAAHAKLYGYSNPARPTEAVQLRLKATGRTAKPLLAGAPGSDGLTVDPGQNPTDFSTPTAIRPVIFHHRPHPTPIYHRDQLTHGMSAEGPAIILTGQSTNIIPPSWTWHLDAPGTLIVTHNKADSKSKTRTNSRHPERSEGPLYYAVVCS